MEPEDVELDLEHLFISPELKAAIRKGIEDGLFDLPGPITIHVDPLCDRTYLHREAKADESPRIPEAVAKVSFINQRVVKPARPERLPSIPIELARCMSCDELTDDCTCPLPTQAELAAEHTPQELQRHWFMPRREPMENECMLCRPARIKKDDPVHYKETE